MIAWLSDALLGAAARAGRQILDYEQRLAMPPWALASVAPHSAKRLSPGGPHRDILASKARPIAGPTLKSMFYPPE